QLCLVDRNRACGHFDFGDSPPSASGMAPIHQPLCGGHDAVCGHVRGPVSADSSWPAMVLLLDCALPEHDGALAAMEESAGLGHVCGRHVFHDFSGVLVHRFDSGSCDVSRQSQTPAHTGCLWNDGDGMAWLGLSLATV